MSRITVMTIRVIKPRNKGKKASGMWGQEEPQEQLVRRHLIRAVL
jgi:hypothetical protein